MDKTISSAAANRNFSKLLRAVRDGQSFVVTIHGKPVARIVPAAAVAGPERWNALVARLRAEPTVDIGRWSRDELYEADPGNTDPCSRG